MDLLVAPAARGLFARVVLQSPPLGDVGQRARGGAALGRGAARRRRRRAGASIRPAAESGRSRRSSALHEQLLDGPAFRGTRGGALPTLDPGTLPASPVQRSRGQPGGRRPDRPHRSGGDVLLRLALAAAAAGGANPRDRSAICATPTSPVRRYSSGYRGDAAARTDAPTDARLAAGRRSPPTRWSPSPLARWARARAAAVGDAAASVYRYRFDHPGPVRSCGRRTPPRCRCCSGRGGTEARASGSAVRPRAPRRSPVALRSAWAALHHDGDPGWAPVDAPVAVADRRSRGCSAASAFTARRSHSRSQYASRSITGHKHQNCVQLSAGLEAAVRRDDRRATHIIAGAA